MEHKAFGVHFTCGPEEGSTLWLLESEIVAHLKGASSLDVEMFWKSLVSRMFQWSNIGRGRSNRLADLACLETVPPAEVRMMQITWR